MSYGEPYTPYAAPAPAAQGVSSLSKVEVRQFLSDVITAAWLLEHGKQSKALAERISKAAFVLMPTFAAREGVSEQHPPRVTEPMVARLEEVMSYLKSRESASEPVEQPAAYRADWPNWRQWHDETGPLPRNWDGEVPTITPLFTHPKKGGDAVRALTDEQIVQMQDERWNLLKCSNAESTAYCCGVFDAERAHGIGGSGTGGAT